MNVNSLDELIKAISVIDQPIVEPLEYRIHYDINGNITMCSMQQHPDSSRYLVVSQHEYENYFRYYVANDRLKKIDIPSGDHVQLVSSTKGYATVKKHAGIIIESTDTYQDIEYYDTNS